MPIKIRGAAEHNLRGIDVDFSDGLNVVTGVSGSGKTSLVFDTLYREAHRRFLDIFALGSSTQRLAPVVARSMEGLGPAIAVGQNLLNRNPGSTLATASGLHPLLRLLYARFGQRHCPSCGAVLAVLSEDEIVDRLGSLCGRGPVHLIAPLARGSLGSHRALLDLLAAQFGAAALLVDGRPTRARRLDPSRGHDIEVRVAELGKRASARQVREAVAAARGLGGQALRIRSGEGDAVVSTAPVCAACGTWFGDLEPQHFHRTCPHCEGTGCGRCRQTGLHPEAASVQWAGLCLPELLAQSVAEFSDLFDATELPGTAQRLRDEISRRVEALLAVGLGYVSLDRPSPSVSRGEAQRVRLAVTMTSRLEDMLHVLDEPTIGQHPHDVERLLPAFRRLPGPVVFVEHDRLAAAVADRAIDLGPGAGTEGGQLLHSGTPAGLWRRRTPTGEYFSLRQRVAAPPMRPEPDEFLEVRGATLRNLGDLDVPLPLGRLTAVTGVSGSGKSTLVEDVLVASLREGRPIGCREMRGSTLKPVIVDQKPIGLNPRSNPATYTKLADLVRDYFAQQTGLSASHFSFNRPEGACPACNGLGATEVQMRYLPSTWIPCAACAGQRFSEEVLAAPARFGDRALSIADFYQLSIGEVAELLDQTVDLSDSQSRSATRILSALCDVGLGYLPLGQPSPTLSGGEAQRVKLAKFLGRRSLARQLLVLDEPTTGLHPQDIAGLLKVLDRLVRSGATIAVVEHNLDLVRAADWIIDLGPGSGPRGGHLLHAGPPRDLCQAPESLTRQALVDEEAIVPRGRQTARGSRRDRGLALKGARAHNLKGVDVVFPKGKLTVVTGVSGSGKSSLVGDVLETEARRRFLESLSLYERQSTREGPEAPVDSVTGLGVAVTIGSGRLRYDPRATVGNATELTHHLAVLLSRLGERLCDDCGVPMRRGSRAAAPPPDQDTEARAVAAGQDGPSRRQAASVRLGPRVGGQWSCPRCDAAARVAEPRHFTSSTYAAACTGCNGVGSLRQPAPKKLIVHPDKPLCAGAMYSPGFFPQGYLGKPYNGGYYMVQALALRYGFDRFATPWEEMSPAAQQAFLFGDNEPLEVINENRKGQITVRHHRFPGFYGWIRDWDVGGTYTDTRQCPDCSGSGLRREYASVQLAGHSTVDLRRLPLAQLSALLDDIVPSAEEEVLVGPALDTARRRLHFLNQVGLGYLNLERAAGTLSAGEAQRVRLAGLLGSRLTSLTVLVDEPTRGLHPREVEALREALHALRDEGNTVIVVEHDPVLIRAADHLVDMGPGAGVAGGRIVAQGKPSQVLKADTLTARWLRGEALVDLQRPRRIGQDSLRLLGAREHNLRGDTLTLPLGTLTGICGVSGSGKSTLLVDTLGRILARRKQTTSVAYEPVEPGEYDSLENQPKRTVVVDQARAGVGSPADFLDLTRALRQMYAESDDARALGIDEKALARSCSSCNGRGATSTDMGFLPDIHAPCETCRGTGYMAEAWDVRVHDVPFPEVFSLTIDEVAARFVECESMRLPLDAARDVGLGYLVLRQPAQALSGGEAQRLKIAAELCRKATAPTLYLLDEPTVGQHLEDVARLIQVLHRLVDEGHTAVVVEHHAHLLAACDWLIELGPGGGPDGGHIISAATPTDVAAGNTPIAPYLREVLEGRS